MPDGKRKGPDKPSAMIIQEVVTAAFTLDVYGHVSEKMKEDSAARMQEYIDRMA